MSKLPRDDNNTPIPVMGFRKNTGQNLTVTATANLSAAFSSHSAVISVYTTTNCFIELGNATIVANTSNSHYIPASSYMDISLDIQSIADTDARYLSVIRSTEDGVMYISERE